MDSKIENEKEVVRCVMFDCLNNYEGICLSSKEQINPFLNENCTEYTED